MNCKNCGEEIPEGKIYCIKCGKEVRLVPDYNILEDDILSTIIKNGTMMDETKVSSSNNQTVSGKNQAENFQGKGQRSKKQPLKQIQRKQLYWGIAGVAFGVFTILGIYQLQEYRHRNSFSYQYQQGEAYEAERAYSSALTYYENAHELEPEDVDTMLKIAKLHMQMDEEESAEEILLEALELSENNEEIYTGLIELYSENQEYDKILDLCNSLTDPSLIDLFTDYVVSQPIFSRISGSYSEPLSIRITSSSDTTIYYTTDGSDPITHGKIYYQPITVKEGTTEIKAVVKNSKGIYSEVSTAKYSVEIIEAVNPAVFPESGNYEDGSQQIKVTVPRGCKVYYTMDGTTPTKNSALYTQPLEMPVGDSFFQAVAITEQGKTSQIVQFHYHRNQ